MGTELIPNTSYHPQIGGQMEIVNKWLEGYLRNYVTRHQRVWFKWLHIGKFCYNMPYHMSIAMSAFRALYGYDALTFSGMVFRDSRALGDKDWVQERQEILRALKNNSQVSQNQQMIYVDKHMVER